MTVRRLLGLSAFGLIVMLVIGVTISALLEADVLITPRTSVTNQVLNILPPTSVPSPKPISMIFLGDMMFDRHIRQSVQKLGGYDGLLSPGLQELFAGADLVVGNLEGPVTDQLSKSVGSAVGSPANYIFTFDPAVVPFLYAANIRLVNLGNNHILNFGQAGLEQTYTLLEQGQITSFGATGWEAEYQRWHSTTFESVMIAFVNYNQFTPNGYAQAVSDLELVRPTHDLVIVYAHWGNEYVPENAVLKQQAREFVKAGADVIIGSHPHVVTGNEVIDGKKVYYSLGNFIFDQYFEPAVRAGLVVEMQYDLETDTLAFTEYPVKLKPDGTTSLVSE